jgi:hypothetical protein
LERSENVSKKITLSFFWGLYWQGVAFIPASIWSFIDGYPVLSLTLLVIYLAGSLPMLYFLHRHGHSGDEKRLNEKEEEKRLFQAYGYECRNDEARHNENEEEEEKLLEAYGAPRKQCRSQQGSEEAVDVVRLRLPMEHLRGIGGLLRHGVLFQWYLICSIVAAGFNFDSIWIDRVEYGANGSFFHLSLACSLGIVDLPRLYRILFQWLLCCFALVAACISGWLLFDSASRSARDEMTKAAHLFSMQGAKDLLPRRISHVLKQALPCCAPFYFGGIIRGQ